MLKYVFAAFGCMLFFSVAQPAKADVLASSHVGGYCMDMSPAGAVLWQCHGGGNQQFSFMSSDYGRLRVGNLCLATTTGRTSSPQGQQLIALECTDIPAQRWRMVSGTLRNEQGYCADVEGGARNQGARIVAWPCNAGASNQNWRWGTVMTQAQAAQRGLIPPGLAGANMQPGAQIVGGQMVAAGAGNMVAAGAGNMVAAGAGNMVAAGGGNMVQTRP